MCRLRRLLPAVLALVALPAAPGAAPPEDHLTLVGRFICAATERRLVERSGENWIAGLADTAWRNETATVWTLALGSGGQTMTAAEAAARLTQRAQQSRMGRLLFRHLLGWAAADGERVPEGILPLGRRRLRFLLERPDPRFPARLAAWEASLCVDPRSGRDSGCGPFRVETRLAPWRQEIRDPAAAVGGIASWERTEPDAEASDTIALSPERRAALIAAVEANGRMPAEAKERILSQLREERVPMQMVERIESRMGG